MAAESKPDCPAADKWNCKYCELVTKCDLHSETKPAMLKFDPTIPAHRLKAFIQQHLGGRCKILSEGSMCACPLCDLDRLYDALRWYEDEAVAISNNVKLQRDQAVLASVQVLVLDAGKHSTDVLGKQQ